MSDITTIWDVNTSEGGWQQEGTSLKNGDDLATAIYISLFTDRTAKPDDVIPDGENKRGWWGDIDQKFPIGSRLWLLSREKQTQDVLFRAREYANEALQWLIEDMAVARIEVNTFWASKGLMAIVVNLYKKDGAKESKRFNWAWKEI